MNTVYKTKLLFLLFIFIFLAADIFGQQDDERRGLVYQIETGFFVGGTGTVSFFTYNSALSGRIAVGQSLRENAIVSGSVAIENNLEGKLYPLAANLKKYIGIKSVQFVNLELGYALGGGENQNSSFKYQGGLAAGFSYGVDLLSIKETDVFIQIGYRLRQTKLTFQAFDGGDPVSNKLDNHFGALQLGVQF